MYWTTAPHAHSSYCYTGGQTFNPQLPTIVFLHGAQHDHSVWALQSRYFAYHGFSVLAVDLPGHGRSEGPALSTIEALSDWLSALLDAANVRQAVLIGHSMGSLIALENASQNTQRILGIALVASAYPMKVADALLAAAQEEPATAMDMVNLWSFSTFSPQPAIPAGVTLLGQNQRLMQAIAKRNPDILYTDFSACNQYANGDVAAQAITCPALFLQAEYDQMTPAKSAAGLLSMMQHAQVVRIPASGHAIMAEQPDAVRTALFQFAQTIYQKN